MTNTRRTSIVALLVALVLALATVFGPAQTAVNRVSDTARSAGILADVPAGVLKRDKSP